MRNLAIYFFTYFSKGGQEIGMKRLNYKDREKLEKMYLAGIDVAEIAHALKVHQTTVYRELKRGATGQLDGNGRIGYSAKQGQITTQNLLKNCKAKH